MNRRSRSHVCVAWHPQALALGATIAEAGDAHTAEEALAPLLFHPAYTWLRVKAPGESTVRAAGGVLPFARLQLRPSVDNSYRLLKIEHADWYFFEDENNRGLWTSSFEVNLPLSARP